MYGAHVMGAARLQVAQEHDGRSRSVRQQRYEVDSIETSGSNCFKYLLFYLFLTAVFVQVWVVVATSNNLPSIIITSILTFFAIIVLIRRHVVANRSYQELQLRRIREGRLRQERSTIMLRPLGLSMRNISGQSPDESAGIPRSSLMTLPTFTYTALETENNQEQNTLESSIRKGSYRNLGGDEEAPVLSTSADDTSQQSGATSSVTLCDRGQASGSHSTRSTTCIVCLTDYLSGDELVRLPCGHDYHRTCVFTWLSAHKLCPVCKQEVVIKPPPTESPDSVAVEIHPQVTVTRATAEEASSNAAIETRAEQRSGDTVGIDSTDLA